MSLFSFGLLSVGRSYARRLKTKRKPRYVNFRQFDLLLLLYVLQIGNITFTHFGSGHQRLRHVNILQLYLYFHWELLRFEYFGVFIDYFKVVV